MKEIIIFILAVLLTIEFFVKLDYKEELQEEYKHNKVLKDIIKNVLMKEGEWYGKQNIKRKIIKYSNGVKSS